MSTQNTSHLFNVPEAEGRQRVELETTAAEAQIQAPTATIAREVEVNAEHAHDAFNAAAEAAKSKGPALTGSNPSTLHPSALEQFEEQAHQKTEAAVAEGHHDIDELKATATGYVEQAKQIAASALSTAQSYLHTSLSGSADATTDLASSIQESASTAISSAKQYLTSAQEVVQPHVDDAKVAAANILGETGIPEGSRKETPSSSTGIPATSATFRSGGRRETHFSSNGIPATSAPLESGSQTVDTPYDPGNVAAQ